MPATVRRGRIPCEPAWSASGAALLLGVLLIGGRAAAEDPADGWRASPPERVTQGADAWLSPGGTWLSFERTERDLRKRDLRGQPVTTSVLYLREVATGRERRADRDGGVTGWVGDERIVFGDGAVLAVTGGADAPPLATSPEKLYTPGWARSRDGTRVAYTVRGFTMEDRGQDPPEGREHTIHLAEAGKPPRPLDLGEDVDMDHADGLLSFSPDGRRLAFHVGFMQMGALPHPRVGVVDLETGESRFVLIETYAARGRSDARWERGPSAWQAWDAAGRRFAFVAAGDGERRDLYGAAADGSDLRRLTVDGDWKASPCLAPEGERCAYWFQPPRKAQAEGPADMGTRWLTSLGMGRGLRVLHLRTGGSVDLPLPSPGYGEDLQWSPDGRHLWFSWMGDEPAQVCRIAAPPPATVPQGTPLIDLQLEPLELLREDLRSPDRHTFERGVVRAAEMDDPRAVEALVEALSRVVRGQGDARPWEVLQLLRARGALAVVPVLLEALSRRWGVQPVTDLLLAWEVDEAVPLWRGLLGAGDEDRAAATVALARFGAEPEWERLRADLSAGSRDFRDAAVRTLASVRDARSVEILIPLTADTTFLYSSDGDVLLGDHAARSLNALTGQSFGRGRASWESWWAEAGRTLPALPGLPSEDAR